MKKKLQFALGLTVIFALYLGVYFLSRAKTTYEPDRFYHLAMAKVIASQGIPHSLPQADNLPWKDALPQAYFLWAILSALFFKLGGESATLLLIPLLSCAVLAVLFRTTNRLAGPLLGCLAVLALPLDPYIFIRLLMLRPFLLALLAFLIMIDGLLEDNFIVTALGGALYAWSYHAIYVPMGFLLLHGLVGAREGNRWWKLHAAGAAGLLAGSVINPTFPHNLLAVWSTFAILFHSLVHPAIQKPLELTPAPLDQWTREHFFEIAVIMASLLVAWNPFPRLFNPREKSPSREQLELSAMLFAILPFWAGALFIPRLVEYSAPVTAVVAAMLFARHKNAVTVAMSSAGVALLGCFFYFAYTSNQLMPPVLDPKYALEALATIPPDASGKKIFNCHWWNGAHIYYARPDLKFVDLADPMALFQASPGLFFMRQQFLDGQVSYPYGMLRSAFHADYVLCESSAAVDEMERDPHFTRLYPKEISRQALATPNMYFLYALADKPVPNFVYHYQTAPVTEPGNPWHSSRSGVGEWRQPTGGQLPFVELRSIDRQTAERSLASQSNILCTAVRPTPEEQRGHSGATLLGVGGGTSVRIWWNGKKLFSTNGGFGQPRLLDLFVHLPRPLSANDDLVALVCAGRNSSFHALTLSFWDQRQVSAFCEPKGKGLLPPEKERDWEYWNVAPQNCIAPLATAAEFSSPGEKSR